MSRKPDIKKELPVTATATVASPELTAQILEHAAGYMAALKPAYRCLYAGGATGIALHLEDYGPIADDSELAADVDHRRRTGQCCLLGAIGLAAQDYGFSQHRIDRELVPQALLPMLNHSPEPKPTTDQQDRGYPAVVLWYDLLPRMSDITLERHGTDTAHAMLTDWLRAAARQAAAG